MVFYINEFSILSPSEKKAFNSCFNNGINLIVGKKDSGKSTLSRSIFYTLGCDVKNNDFINKLPDNIYILDFNIDNINYILIRKRLKKGKGKNYFKIIKNNKYEEVFYDTTSFKDCLNDILKIEVITRNTKKEETTFFPNHIFLPFYTDQDFSWQNYLNSTFSNIAFIPDYKKTILEYFTGARPNDYYSLQLKKTKLKIDIDEISALIKSKEIIIKENRMNIKIIEDIDFESFVNNYEYFLELYKNTISSEHKIKSELNTCLYEQNVYHDVENNLKDSIENYVERELNTSCPNCNQIINKSMESNYKLYMTQENLINERDKIKMNLKEINNSISLKTNKLELLKDENKKIKEVLDANAEMIDLNNRIDSYALNRVNNKLNLDIDELRVKRDKKNEKLKDVVKNLNELNNIDVSTPYRELMIRAFEMLNIEFSYNSYYTSNLESVKISLSGASKVQAFIAQYLSIYEIIVNNENVIRIPMFIDTFLKDDFNETELSRTSDFIFQSLENKHQSFIFISDNNQTLSSIDKYNFNKIDLIEKSNLLDKDYDEIFNKYSSFIIGNN